MRHKILILTLVAILLALPAGGTLIAQEVEGIETPEEVGPEPASLASPTAVNFTITPLTDNTQEDTEPALAVDSSGKAHVAYNHAGDLHYVTNASGAWISTTIAADAVTEFRPSITVDGSDAVHLTYYAGEAPDVDLYYASNAGGTWGGELIQTVSIPNVWTLDGGIAVDDAGLAYVVYVTHDGNDPEIGLRYQESARRRSPALAPGGGWVGSTVTDNEVYDRWPSIAVGVTGTVHVAYTSYYTLTDFNPDVWHGTYSGGQWRTERLTQSTWKEEGMPSLALDGSDKVHVVWQALDMASPPEIVYATDASGGWVTQTLTLNEVHDQDASIVLDGSGKAFVSYMHHGPTYHVHYTTNASGTWSGDQVSDSTTDNTLTTMDRAVAVDGAGYLHVVWSGNDGGDAEIYYARSDAPIAPPPNDAPYAPSNPRPADGATRVPVTAALRWDGGDPDAGDTVTYDVYLSTGTIPYLEQSGLTTTVYTPTQLKAGWSYVWKIVARDDQGAATEGPVWSFSVVQYKIFLPLALR
jgi:hypothetical protein